VKDEHEERRDPVNAFVLPRPAAHYFCLHEDSFTPKRSFAENVMRG